MSQCMVNTCLESKRSNGYCAFHYNRMKAGRDLFAPKRIKIRNHICHYLECNNRVNSNNLCLNHYNKLHTTKNKKQEWQIKNKFLINERARIRYEKIRKSVLSHYSNGIIKCACCNEDFLEFMTLEHNNGGGAKHRKSTGVGEYYWKWFIKNNYPKAFSVLCWNCNWGTRMNNGVCPHKLR